MEGVCRCCLQSSLSMRNIFAEKINEKLSEICKINIEVDGLPQTICELCMEKTLDFHNFKNECIKSDQTLRKLLFPIATNEHDSEAMYSMKIGTEENIFSEDINNIIEDIHNENFDRLPFTPESLENLIENEDDSVNCLCRICDAHFDGTEKLKEHVEMHVNSFSSLEKQTNNLNLRESLDIYCCEKCNNIYESPQMLDEHIKENICEKNMILDLNEFLPVNPNIQVGTNDLECKMCDKNFDSKTLLKTHIDEIHLCLENNLKEDIESEDDYYEDIDWENGEFSCEDSNYSDTLKCSDLKQNKVEKQSNLTENTLNSTATKLTLECNICRQTFNRYYHYIKHLQIHFKSKKIYKCQFCPKIFKLSANCKEHEKLHNDKANYQCDICDKKYKSLSQFINHRKTHTEVHNCEKCDKVYLHRFSLKDHYKIHHKEVYLKLQEAKDFTNLNQCAECGKTFEKRINYYKHIKRHKDTVKNFKCPENDCGKEFFTKQSLESHYRVHTKIQKQKKIECLICKKRWSTNSQLQVHLRTHTNERPFKCNVCDKGFLLNIHLKTHLSVHTGEKNFICDFPKCGKKYSSSSCLRKHKLTIHDDGPKNFKCESCDQTFALAYLLKTHSQTHHENKKGRKKISKK